MLIIRINIQYNSLLLPVCVCVCIDKIYALAHGGLY